MSIYMTALAMRKAAEVDRKDYTPTAEMSYAELKERTKQRVIQAVALLKSGMSKEDAAEMVGWKKQQLTKELKKRGLE